MENKNCGSVVVAKCPSYWHLRLVEQLCMNPNSTDALRQIPVYDFLLSRHFKNVFCAVCNGAQNYTYWKINSIFESKEKTKNMTMAAAIRAAIRWTAEPHTIDSVEYCVPTPSTDKSQNNSASQVLRCCSILPSKVHEKTPKIKKSTLALNLRYKKTLLYNSFHIQVAEKFFQ